MGIFERLRLRLRRRRPMSELRADVREAERERQTPDDEREDAAHEHRDEEVYREPRLPPGVG